ncbi:MAG: hypothetical protein VW270_21960, partial [Candidatus Poseidoniales archaeon]
YMFASDQVTPHPDYTADLVLDDNKTLTGLVSCNPAASNVTVSGFQTDFLTELKVGDIVSFPSGAGGALEERRVASISSSA